MVVLPFVLDHPLKPLHPIHKHRDEQFSVDSTEYLAYRALQSLPVCQMDSLELLFQKTKEEEVTRGEVRAISWLRHPLGFCALETIIGLV